MAKFSSDSMGQEEELTFKYKAPVYMNLFFSRLIWGLTFYTLVYYVFFLGDQAQAFYDVSLSSPHKQPGMNEYAPKYEQTYLFTRRTMK